MASYSILSTILHDLRQPLGTIETSVFYLNMLLGKSNPQATEQLHVIERQVGEAALLLVRAAAELRAAADESAQALSLELTKSETAAVT